jgi:hypothetical protein
MEYSNRLNFQFAQTRWFDAQQQRVEQGRCWHTVCWRLAARIWSRRICGARGKLVNAISTQTGWLGPSNILNAPPVV